MLAGLLLNNWQGSQGRTAHRTLGVDDTTRQKSEKKKLWKP
jgi:hypothetical protein